MPRVLGLSVCFLVAPSLFLCTPCFLPMDDASTSFPLISGVFLTFSRKAGSVGRQEVRRPWPGRHRVRRDRLSVRTEAFPEACVPGEVWRSHAPLMPPSVTICFPSLLPAGSHSLARAPPRTPPAAAHRGSESRPRSSQCAGYTVRLREACMQGDGVQSRVF